MLPLFIPLTSFVFSKFLLCIINPLYISYISHFPHFQFSWHFLISYFQFSVLLIFPIPFPNLSPILSFHFSSNFILKSMWNTAVGIKNCKQIFSLRVAFTTQKKATRSAEMMSVERVAIFWVVNASSGEKSCLQFSIPTGSGAGEEGGVSHSLKDAQHVHSQPLVWFDQNFSIVRYKKYL